jgi:hypothetical protein
MDAVWEQLKASLLLRHVLALVRARGRHLQKPFAEQLHVLWKSVAGWEVVMMMFVKTPHCMAGRNAACVKSVR